jgi:hypothetical protein
MGLKILYVSVNKRRVTFQDKKILGVLLGLFCKVKGPGYQGCPVYDDDFVVSYRVVTVDPDGHAGMQKKRGRRVFARDVALIQDSLYLGCI